MDLGRIAVRIAKRCAMEVPSIILTRVDPVAYGEDEISFEVEGKAGEQGFEATVEIDPEMRLWNLTDGEFPETDDINIDLKIEQQIIKELLSHPIVEAARIQALTGTN